MSWPDSAPPLHWVLRVSLPELFKSWDPHKCLSSPHTPSRSTFSFSPSHCLPLSLPPSLPPPSSGRPSFPSSDGCSYFPWLGLFGAKRRLMKLVSLGHRRRMTGKTFSFSFRGCFMRFGSNIEAFHTSVLLHFHTSSFVLILYFLNWIHFLPKQFEHKNTLLAHPFQHHSIYWSEWMRYTCFLVTHDLVLWLLCHVSFSYQIINYYQSGRMNDPH